MKLTRWLPTLERLEAREVPATTAALSQVAVWGELGPNAISNGQTSGITSPNPNGGAALNNATIGTISVITPHPTDPNVMFAGAPNGGVWRTQNAQAASPTWTPLTDQLASMSVADITFDPTNLNRVVVGIGATADGGEVEPSGTVRGDRVGLLVTDNALATTPTWRIVGGPLSGRDVVKVAVRGARWTVGTSAGLFHSEDDGVTFTNTLSSSINNGLTYQNRPFTSRVYDLAQNPRLLNQLYVATEPFAGLTRQVWRSDDFGLTWGTVTDTQMQLSTNTTSVKISVRDTASNDNQVYVATVNTLPVPVSQRFLPGANTVFAWENRNNVLSSICWSTNQGGNWTRMDQPRRMTAPEGLDLFQRRDGDPFQGGGLRADGGRILVVTDEVRNGIQFGDGFPHRLQTGDLVYIEGVFEFPLTVPPAVPPGDRIFDRGNGAFYFIEVRDAYSFYLLNETAPSQLMDSRNVTWQRTEDATPGEAGFMDIVAAPSNPALPNSLENQLYLGGDFSQFRFQPGGIPVGAGTGGPFPSTFTGSVWQGDRFVVPPNFGDSSAQWENMTDGGAGNTAPGGDTREMVFDALGNLWVATGTGIYRRSTVANSPWVHASGNIRVGQFWGVGFDARNNLVVGATQDTGMVEQSTSGALGFQSVLTRDTVIVRDPNPFPAIDDFDVNSPTFFFSPDDIRNYYTDQQYAYEVAVDNTSNPNRSIRYYASSTFGQLNQNGDAFSFIPGVIRRVYDTAGNLLQTSALRFGSALTTTQPLSGLNFADRALSTLNNGRMDSSARIVMDLNANDATRGVYGQSRVYEDSDPLGPGSSPETGFVVSDVTPTGMTGRVRSLSYGGKRAGTSFNQVLFVGTTTGQLWIRGEFGPTFNQAAPGTGEVTDILQDPDDYRHAFVAQGGQVYETRDLGLTWTNLSAGLVAPPDPTTGLPSAGALTTQIYTIALFDPSPGTANVGMAGDVVLLAGGRGGVFRRSLSVCGTTGVWSEYGNGLPNSVVMDLEVVGNRLVAGTFGRGVWTIDDVAPTLTNLTTLFVTSDGAGDNIVIAADTLDPNAVIVTANGTQIGRFSFGQFDRITINGNGGADTVQIGQLSSTRFVNYPIGAHLGGDAGDTLIVEANGSTADIRATITPTTVGNGVGDTIFAGCGSLTYSGLNSGKLEVRTGSGNDLLIITQGTYPHPVETNTGAGNDSVVVDGLSSGVVNAIDGAGSNDVLEVYVQPGQVVFGSDSRLFVIDNLRVNLGAGFEAILLNGQGSGGSLQFAGSGLDDDFFLTSDGTGLANESQLLAYTPNTSTNPTKMRFVNLHTVTVNAGAGNDRMIVGASGKTSFVTYQVNANMEGGAGDTVQILANGTTTAVQATITPTTVGAGAGDTLFGANGRLNYSGLDSLSEKLDLRTGFGDDRVIVSGGTYPHLVETNTGAGNDTVVLDGMLVGTVNPVDGVGTNDTIEVLVYPGQVVYGSDSRVFAVGGLLFSLPPGFESILFNGQGAGGTIEFSGSGNDDDFFLTSDGTGVPGESQLIAFTPNTSPSPQRVRFVNMPTVTVNAGAGNDRLIVDANRSAAGGTTKFVTYLINAGMGGQAGDQIIVDDSSTGTPTRATINPSSIASNLGTDSLFGANGRLFYGGVSTLFLNTGSANDVVVFDSTTALTTQLNGGGGSNLALVSGSGGNDTVNVGAPQITANGVLTVNTTNVQTFQVVGNGGTNVVNVGGSAGDDTLVVNQSAAQSGDVGGLPVRLVYQTVGTLNLIPYGGTNSLIWHDVSGLTFGSANNPGGGVEFLPTTATGGFIRLANGVGTSVFFDGVNGGFVMNGDPTGSNTADTLTVHGVSTTGQASFGERTAGDGSDTITADENGVSVSNATLGTLRSVSFGRSPNGRVGFGTVWVRGGNESGAGDTVNSRPTLLTNLLLDGGNPTAAPGDTLNVTTNGPAVSSPNTDPALGPPHTRIINRGDQASLGHLNFELVSANTVDPNNPTGPTIPSFGSRRADLFVTGTNGNTLAQVNVYNLDGSLRFSLNPFAGYGGPVKVAEGDVTGDGKSDVIVAAGPGGGPHVKVYDGQTQAEVRSFFAYDPAFTGGVTVAADDFNNDGRADIVTGSATGASHVKVFSGANLSELFSFFAYPDVATNGVNVAAGDVNGDGTPEIITGTAQGSAPVVRAFSGTNLARLRDFFGYDPGFVGGVNVAAGDLNGDGQDDIVLGAGPGGGPHVKAFDGATSGELLSFFANDPITPGAPPTAFTGGVFVAAGDFDNDGRSELLTGAGAGSFALARVIKVLPGPSQLYSVNAFAGYAGGVSVGA